MYIIYMYRYLHNVCCGEAETRIPDMVSEGFRAPKATQFLPFIFSGSLLKCLPNTNFLLDAKPRASIMPLQRSSPKFGHHWGSLTSHQFP